MQRTLKLALVTFFLLPLLFTSALAQQAVTPVLLDELNTAEYDAGYPCLSRYGCEIYFARGTSDGIRLFVATRPNLDAPFDNIQRLTDLENGNSQASPWISDDGLRLYYSEGVAGDDYLKMAYRPATDWPWVEIRTFTEIHLPGYDDKSPSLTSDELTVFYNSNRPFDEEPQGRIWVATRPNISASFGTPEMVDELAPPPNGGTNSPSISSDGLEINFCRFETSYTTGNRLYHAHRNSTSEPFGPMLPWDDINELGTFFHQPYVLELPSMKQIYFYAEIDGQIGIWVTPYLGNPADLNGDFMVDLLDFAIFAENWLWGVTTE